MIRTKTAQALTALCFALGVAGGSRAYVLEQRVPAVRTTINFFETEKFTDVKDRSSSDAPSAALLTELKTFLVQQASRYISASHKLVITITDIDLAGDFEPWHGASFDHVRIVKDIYRPRIELVFRITDAEGNVLREGKRVLSDSTFMSRLTLDRNDPLRYEKQMIEDWIRAEFQAKSRK